MDIKCKGITARLPVKICCVILIPVMAFISLLGLVGIVQLRDTEYFEGDGLLFADFSGNDYFFDRRAEQALLLVGKLFIYKSEANIKAMNCLEWEPNTRYYRDYSDYAYEHGDEYPVSGVVYSVSGVEYSMNAEDNSGEQWYTLYSTFNDGTSYGAVPASELGGDYAKQLERNAIANQINDFQQVQEMFKRERGLYYYISDGELTLTNLAEDQRVDFIRRQPVYIIQQNGRVAEESRGENSPRTYRGYWYDLEFGGDTTMYIAYSPQSVEWHNSMWRYMQHRLAVHLAYVLAPFVVAFVLMLMLLAGAGRRTGESKTRVFFTVLDKPWLDVGFALVSGFEFAVLDLCTWAANQAWQYANLQGLTLLCTVPAIFGTLPVVWWLVSFAKRVKAGKWWRYTMCHAVIRAFLRGLGKAAASLWAGAPLTARVALMGAGGFLASTGVIIVTYGAESFAVGVFSSLLCTAAIVALMLRYARKINLLAEGAKAASAGDYGRPIDVKGGELGSIADSINNISDGINAAVSERLRSERLKTELITNVSHDIRTPLTSLITYTDLLKNEGLDSEKAPGYLEVLIQKSARLKTLTDDLFEATKAASGNVEVQLESLDLADLIRQVLGELDERVKASGLDFRLDLPEHAYVTADGRLLWRVAENLLSNVFKYAAKASRVYLGVARENGSWALGIKNISEHELNVDPIELTERFKRGDDSRGGDGSGLGLSIAQSFTQAQGGAFSISIDGDLFKATVKLPAV